MTCTRHLSPCATSPIVCIKISEIRSSCSFPGCHISKEQKYQWVLLFQTRQHHCVARRLSCSWANMKLLFPTGEGWTPPTEWSPSLWPHSHIRKSSSYRNTATRYGATLHDRAPTSLWNVLGFFSGSQLSGFDLNVAFGAVLWTLTM